MNKKLVYQVGNNKKVRVVVLLEPDGKGRMLLRM